MIAAAAESDQQPVLLDVKDGIAWVTLNRPDKRNALSPMLNRRMLEILDEVEADPDVGVMVLTGAGEAFSAGMDLDQYFRQPEAAGRAAVLRARREAYEWKWRRLMYFEKPTIAMVNGWCFGGGYGPLFACDLAFAADEAQFGLSEINWGILPGGGATKVAVELLPFRKAMYHAMMGENVDGRTAADWGLVNESLPLAQLKARVTEVANVLLKKNPVALKATKDAVRRVSVMSYDDAEDYLIRAQEAANSYDNHGRKEGIRQFIDEKSYKPGLGAYDKDKAGV